MIPHPEQMIAAELLGKSLQFFRRGPEKIYTASAKRGLDL